MGLSGYISWISEDTKCTAMDVQSLFDTLSDETRRRIVLLLMRNGEQCVCNIYGLLDISQPKASRHLAVMREAGLVSARREGKWMHYRLHPEMPLWCYRILQGMRDGTPDLEPAADQSPCNPIPLALPSEEGVAKRRRVKG